MWRATTPPHSDARTSARSVASSRLAVRRAMTTNSRSSRSGVAEIAMPSPPIDWACPTNQIALPTDTAEYQPSVLSGALTHPSRAGMTTTAQVPSPASTPARSALDMAPGRAGPLADGRDGLDSVLTPGGMVPWGS